MRQTAGGDERWHGGFEVGASVFVLEDIEVGYRAWLPRGGRAGFVSEDGDPVYRQGRTHRARLGLSQTFGPVTIDGRLDVMVPEAASDKIQYLAVTRVRFRWSFPVANIGSLDGLADASTP